MTNSFFLKNHPFRESYVGANYANLHAITFVGTKKASWVESTTLKHAILVCSYMLIFMDTIFKVISHPRALLLLSIQFCRTRCPQFFGPVFEDALNAMFREEQ